MPFKLGDKVTTKNKGNTYYTQYKIGTIVEIITHHGMSSNDGSPWCYVSWENSTEDTYVHKFDGKIYRHVYGFYASSLELVELAKVKADDPALPADPRLRGIAIKIRDIETRFKNRHNTYEYNNKERELSDFQRSKVCTG